MDKIPPVLVEYMLSFLGVRDRAIFSRTCKKYRRYNTSAQILVEKLAALAYVPASRDVCAYCESYTNIHDIHHGLRICYSCYLDEELLEKPLCFKCDAMAKLECEKCGDICCKQHLGQCCKPEMCCDVAKNKPIVCADCKTRLCRMHRYRRGNLYFCHYCYN